MGFVCSTTLVWREGTMCVFAWERTSEGNKVAKILQSLAKSGFYHGLRSWHLASRSWNAESLHRIPHSCYSRLNVMFFFVWKGLPLEKRDKKICIVIYSREGWARPPSWWIEYQKSDNECIFTLDEESWSVFFHCNFVKYLSP